SSVVHTGVKSFGCENKTAQESPIQSWKWIRPWVVSASKSGAISPIFIVLSPSLSLGILFQTPMQKSTVALRDQVPEFWQIDVTAGNNRDNRASAGFPTQRCSHRQSAGSLGNDACFFSQQAHRIFCLLERDYEVAVHNWFHTFPHAREHALTSGA